MSDLFKAEASKPFRRHLDLLRLMRCAPRPPAMCACVHVCEYVGVRACRRAAESERDAAETGRRRKTAAAVSGLVR